MTLQAELDHEELSQLDYSERRLERAWSRPRLPSRRSPPKPELNLSARACRGRNRSPTMSLPNAASSIRRRCMATTARTRTKGDKVVAPDSSGGARWHLRWRASTLGDGDWRLPLLGLRAALSIDRRCFFRGAQLFHRTEGLRLH